MARFLDTRAAVSEISALIKNADKTLVLITPYLKLSSDFKEMLAYRDSQRKSTTIIYGKTSLADDEKQFLAGLRGVVLRYHQNLHAKCYYNDEFIILTSLNLYDFSMVHNKEMGVLIDRNDPNDGLLAMGVLQEVEMISHFSELVPKKAKSNKRLGEHGLLGSFFKGKKKEAKESGGTKPNGYCIRTGVQIPFDLEMPFCPEAYERWNQYKNRDYSEKYCHFSGEPGNGQVSMNRPILRKHWSAAKETFGF